MLKTNGFFCFTGAMTISYFFKVLMSLFFDRGATEKHQVNKNLFFWIDLI